jgi:phosphoglycerate kinase
MQAEIEALQAALQKPARPVTAVVGGAKISTKLPVLENLIGRVDHLIIGGAMATTFLLAHGARVGRSLVEHDLAERARGLLSLALARGCRIVLPVDAVCAKELHEDTETTIARVDDIPADQMILDVGPESRQAFCEILAASRTLLWNGPLGVFETRPFGSGTFAVAACAAELTQSGKLITIAGGGDTVAALNAAGVTGHFTYVSTAGGAFLEWLEGRVLPGVAALIR